VFTDIGRHYEWANKRRRTDKGFHYKGGGIKKMKLFDSLKSTRKYTLVLPGSEAVKRETGVFEQGLERTGGEEVLLSVMS